MKGLLLTCLLWTGALAVLPVSGWAQDGPSDAADREIIERLTRVETRLEGLEDSIRQLREDMTLQNQQLREDIQLQNRQLREDMTLQNQQLREDMQLQNQHLREDMQQLREDLNHQLDRHFQLILGVLAAFTLMFVSILGFAIWDRRTLVRPFADKVTSLEDDLATKGHRLDVILDALRSLGQRDERVATILKRLNLL